MEASSSQRARDTIELELEDVWSDLHALRKLYALLQKRNAEALYRESKDELDEKSRQFLKKLLDDATQRVLQCQAKIIASCASHPLEKSQEEPRPIPPLQEERLKEAGLSQNLPKCRRLQGEESFLTEETLQMEPKPCPPRPERSELKRLKSEKSIRCSPTKKLQKTTEHGTPDHHRRIHPSCDRVSTGRSSRDKTNSGELLPEARLKPRQSPLGPHSVTTSSTRQEASQQEGRAEESGQPVRRLKGTSINDDLTPAKAGTELPKEAGPKLPPIPTRGDGDLRRSSKVTTLSRMNSASKDEVTRTIEAEKNQSKVKAEEVQAKLRSEGRLSRAEKSPSHSRITPAMQSNPPSHSRTTPAMQSKQRNQRERSVQLITTQKAVQKNKEDANKKEQRGASELVRPLQRKRLLSRAAPSRIRHIRSVIYSSSSSKSRLDSTASFTSSTATSSDLEWSGHANSMRMIRREVPRRHAMEDRLLAKAKSSPRSRVSSRVALPPSRASLSRSRSLAYPVLQRQQSLPAEKPFCHKSNRNQPVASPWRMQGNGRKKKPEVIEQEGRLKKLKNKLSIIFHHHHHHHLHNGDESSDSSDEDDGTIAHHHHRSPWEYLRSFIRHQASQEERGKHVERRRAPPAESQHGYLQKLLEGLIGYVWGSRKRKVARADRGRLGKMANRVRPTKLHWWRRRGGIKLASRKKPRLRLGTSKALTHERT